VLGLIFFAYGAQKMLGWFGGFGFTGTMGFFTSVMHIPAVFAFLAICAESVGGLGLIFRVPDQTRSARNLQYDRGHSHGSSSVRPLDELDGSSEGRGVRVSPARAGDYDLSDDSRGRSNFIDRVLSSLARQAARVQIAR
jgi:MarR family transcriptional regulator, 2-MHQ and catechol-resistance regulon repressor